MKRSLFYIYILFCTSYSVFAQYEPAAINYGIVTSKTFGSENEFGAGVRIEYAYNCYTTYMAEYNRTFIIGNTDQSQGYNEVALGVNLILFNWYPTTITAGFGYIGNNSPFTEQIKQDGFIAFTSGDSFNHGAQIKIRALYNISIPVHIFAELNVKSLGTRYNTFLIGVSYDFDAR